MQFNKSTGLGETLISEMPGPRAELLQHTNSLFMFEGKGVPLKEVVNRENFVQNREEFLGDVHQDNANSKISMRLPVTGRNHENGVGIYQQCYEDLTANLALQRMDSGCSAHGLDFDSAMGSMENGIYFNNNCGVPDKDTAFGQGVTKAPTVNGFDQANSSLGVQHLAEDSVSLQGLKKSSNVNQSSASAPNLTEMESAQSSSQSHNEISGGLQPKKIKFLCGFGGKILPRPSDGKLRYVGGETRMVTIRVNITWAELVQKTSELCNQPHTIKYQLPGEELDALISVSSDEDLQNMIEEYYSSEKLGSSQRLRIFLIPLIESDDQSAIDTSDVQQSDPDYQYVVAVNGVTRVDSNLSEYSNEKAMETDLSHLTSTLDRNTSFQENTLSSWNPSQSVNILNGSTPLMNGPQDTISPAIHCAPLPPVTIQQRDLRNGFSLLHKAKLSPDSSEGLPLFTTVASPPEIYSNHVPTSHNFPTLGGTSNANNNGALGVQVSQMNSPATQILPMPILELRGHNMQECSSDRPVVEERVLHSEKPFPCPDDTMNVFCESKNSIPANHGMPHAFSDSKLHEYEGINQYFSLNSPKPPLSVSPDLLEKPTQSFQQNEDIGFSNPYLKSKTSSAEQVFHNQGPNFINFSFDSETDKETEPVPWDISINRQNLQSVISASYEHRCIIREQEENCSNSEFIDDTVKQFDDKNSTAGALETLDFYVDQTFYVGNNNQQQSIRESRELEPPSICLKPSKEQLVNKQLLLTESPRNQSNINQSETAEIVNNCAQTSSNVNLVTDLLSGLCSSLASIESSVRQPFSCSNHMGMENSILTNCTQPPSAVIETEKVYHNAHVRREYSLIDDDWSGNNNGIQRLELQDNCTGNLQNSSAVVLDELKVPMSTSYSRTTQHTVDVVHAAYPSPSTIEAERTLEELLSAADEHFEDGSNGQISDATKAEKEAEEYGLQIIKNSDLEDLRELGSGTYGTVYHGRWKGTDVAIKRIRKTCFSGRLSQQERLTKDFWKEALVLSKLHHPNIVAFYGAVPDGAGGTLATVTEYMSHGSLRSVLVKKDRFLDYRRKLRITMDSAIGMEYLHSRNIIHFDLKCDNLLVSLRDPERPVCKVGDFGLSKIKQNTLVSGGVRGSLPWMAPELLSGSTDLVSDKVDVFSFGISMWEILTGEEPYKNMHCGLIIGGIIKNTLRPPIPERCDPEWRKLMEQCWSINPEERPSFTEISNRLRSMYAVLEAKGKSNQETKA